MATPKTPLLDLNTFLERATVRLRSEAHPDGVDYELRNPGELTLLERVKVSKQAPALASFGDENAVAELSKVLDEVCRIVLIAPDDMHARLTDHMRLAIVLAFIELSPMNRRSARATMTAPPAAASPRTTAAGANSSRNLSSGTAARRASGSRRSRSRSSGAVSG